MTNLTVVQQHNAVTATQTATAVELSSSGPQGPAGPPGPAGGAVFSYTQSVTSQVWTIHHNLARFPVVLITELDGVPGRYLADYADVDNNTLTITFSQTHTGKAELE